MQLDNGELAALVKQVGERLVRQKKKVVTAESCTGGGLAQVLTMVTGSAEWFDRGFVTYCNESKQDMLDVRGLTLHQHGAVSEEVAREMAEGALRHSQADISVSITGIAGPTKPEDNPEKPVGLVWFGFAGKDFSTIARSHVFGGDRYQVRYDAVKYALETLIELITKDN